MDAAGRPVLAGTDMITPPRIPANDRLASRARTIAASASVLAALALAALTLPSLWSGAAAPGVAQAEPALTAQNAADLCRRLFEEPREYIDDTAQRRRWDLRAASCKMAFEADPANTELKVAAARNLPYERKTEAVAMIRSPALLPT